jgi:hypothetical protein
LLDDGLVASVVIGLHRDLSSGSTVAALKSVCSALLDLRPPGPPPRSPTGATCRLELCRASGKVVVEVLGLTVADHAVTLTHTSGEGQGQDGSSGGAQSDATTTAVATGASSSAPARAPQNRDAVPAAASAANTRPYTLTEAEQRSMLEGGSSAGRIFYQPDDTDDFDDEDPDDDLDI